MTTSSTYLHVIDGRVRVKIQAVKGSPQAADLLGQRLRRHEGVLSVNANPVTGNVLVHFDPSVTSVEAILGRLRQMGYLSGHLTPLPVADNGKSPTNGVSVLANPWTKTLIQVAAEAAVQSAVRHLITALL